MRLFNQKEDDSSNSRESREVFQKRLNNLNADFSRLVFGLRENSHADSCEHCASILTEISKVKKEFPGFVGDRSAVAQMEKATKECSEYLAMKNDTVKQSSP